MEPTIEQLSQQHAAITTEANNLESRITQLRTDATRVEGVIIYLNQQAEAKAKESESVIETVGSSTVGLKTKTTK
jgi:prefoldin subunit 5